MIVSSSALRICAFIVFTLSFTRMCCGVQPSAIEKRETNSAMNHSISLVVRTERRTYPMESHVEISVSLQNNGDKPVYIDRRMYWTGFGGGLELDISDADGKHLAARPLSDALMPPPEEGDESILVRLDSGFFYGTSVNLNVKDFFRKPGKYSIRVIYKSWLNKDFVAPELRNLPALWDDTPQIISEPVWINVIQ